MRASKGNYETLRVALPEMMVIPRNPILPLSRRWMTHKIAVWQVFLLFWLADTVVPLAYQLIFLSPMPLPLAVLIGFFPAVVIAIGIRIGYKRGIAAS